MITDKQAEFIFDKLNKIDRGLAINFANSNNKDQWLVDNEPVLEGFSEYTDNYKNLGELRGDKYMLLNDFYSEQGGKSPSEPRIASFRKKHPEISEDEIKEYFSKVNEYKAEEERQREYEAGVKQRQQEVKRWPFYKDWLTSEYSKERYIKEPEKSVFGPGPYYNKGEDIADIILGGTSVAAELIPGWGGALGGPAIRGMRDVLNYNTPYSKDVGDLANDIFTDFGTNVLIARLPNFRREQRMTKGMGGKNVSKYLDYETELNATRQNLGMFRNIDDVVKEAGSGEWMISNRELYDAIDRMADSDLKAKLKQLAPAASNIDRDAIHMELRKAQALSEIAKDPETIQAAKEIIDKPGEYAMASRLDPKELPPEYQIPSKRINEVFGTGLGKKMAEVPELTKFEKKVSLPLTKGTRAILNDYSDQAMRLGTDAGAFPGKKSSPVEGPSENLVRQWLLGFRPKEMPGDPMWEQYVRWRDDYNKKYGKEFGEIE